MPGHPRAHTEVLEAAERPDGSGEVEAEVVAALGACANNQPARRGKLTPGQLAQLAEHGVVWA
ncbi:hypothetical protein ACIF6L_31970 [Kitasatospora sp. NPDC086009]|uniref:hypothetical protein n=1 Tax=unclassified Kitasatospora TaxID=2633591 RepID=UPI0037C942E5